MADYIVITEKRSAISFVNIKDIEGNYCLFTVITQDILYANN